MDDEYFLMRREIVQLSIQRFRYATFRKLPAALPPLLNHLLAAARATTRPGPAAAAAASTRDRAWAGLGTAKCTAMLLRTDRTGWRWACAAQALLLSRPGWLPRWRLCPELSELSELSEVSALCTAKPERTSAL